MKKLKKQTVTKYLQRVRAPNAMTLKEYSSFYSKLVKKYGDSKTLKIVSRSGYYSDGGYWLIERRLETDAELAKRQNAYDKRMAMQKAQTERYNALRKADALKSRAADKKHKDLLKKAQLEKKVEDVKIMVKALQMSGFTVNKGKSSSARN